MTASKPVLILQLRPEDDTSDSEYQAILKYGGLAAEDTHRLRIEKTGIPELSLDDYAAVIVGGSPFDISTPEHLKKPIQLQIESDFRRLFDDIVSNDRPFLGACSGCGLLGSYLDTPISGKYSEPVGGAVVSVTAAGREDSLLDDFPEQIAVLCGHKEACDQVPQGATLLLSGDACPVQMFRVGDNVYATQFHPEGDGPGFTVRIHAYKHHGYFPAEQADELIVAVNQQDTPYAREILRRFVARYVN
jgi:GMP synthase (glutamine-hydrolysing)